MPEPKPQITARTPEAAREFREAQQRNRARVDQLAAKLANNDTLIHEANLLLREKYDMVTVDALLRLAEFGAIELTIQRAERYATEFENPNE